MRLDRDSILGPRLVPIESQKITVGVSEEGSFPGEDPEDADDESDESSGSEESGN